MTNPNNFGTGSGNPPVVPGPLSSGEDQFRGQNSYGQQPPYGQNPYGRGQYGEQVPYGQQPNYRPGTEPPVENPDAAPDEQWPQQGQYVQPVIADPGAPDYGQAAAPGADEGETVVQPRTGHQPNPYEGEGRHRSDNPYRAHQPHGQGAPEQSPRPAAPQQPPAQAHSSRTEPYQEQRFQDPRAQNEGRGGATAADRTLLESNPRVPGDNRNLGEIMGDLTNDFSTLMRQEVALAKAEITQSVRSAGKGAGLLGGAGFAGYMTLLFGSFALWWLIAHLLNGDAPKYGWSFLIVAVLWGIAAAVMAAKGKSELNEVQGVPQTEQTLKQIPDALKGNEEKN